MGSEKYCPLASIRGGVGSKCIGEQCAWWIEDCGACVFVALLRTGVEDLREQNLELAGSVVSYDAQLHELEKKILDCVRLLNGIADLLCEVKNRV